MPNLAKTQTQWTDFWREMLQYLRPARIFNDLAYRFAKARIRVLEEFDTTAKMSAWTFAGAKRGINCSEEGRLWITVEDETPGAGQARTKVFMDAAKTLEVARGDAADGATATLVAQNSSGLTGTVTIGTITVNLTAIILILDIDEKLKADRAFQTDEGGLAAKAKFTELVESARDDALSARDNMVQDANQNFMLKRLQEFMGSTSEFVLASEEIVDDNGDLSVKFTGLLAELRDCMEDELTAGAQHVKTGTVTVGSATFDADNEGLGSFGSTSAKQNLRSGKVIFKCTAGLTAGTIPENFDVTFRDDLTGAISAAQSPLSVKDVFESADFGFSGTLTRTITEINDGGNQLSAYVINGETTENTDSGILYVELTDTAGTRKVQMFKAGAKTAADLVLEGTLAGDGVITLVEQNSSGLSGTVAVVYAADDLDIQIDLNFFDEDDEFHLFLTNLGNGKISKLFADLYAFPLPVDPAPTITDTLLEEGAEIIVNHS